MLTHTSTLFDFAQNFDPWFGPTICIVIAGLLSIAIFQNRHRVQIRNKLGFATGCCVASFLLMTIPLVPSYMCYRSVYEARRYAIADGVVKALRPEDNPYLRGKYAFLIQDIYFEIEGARFLSPRLTNPEPLLQAAHMQQPIRVYYTSLCDTDGKNVILRLEVP